MVENGAKRLWNGYIRGKLMISMVKGLEKLKIAGNRRFQNLKNYPYEVPTTSRKLEIPKLEPASD